MAPSLFLRQGGVIKSKLAEISYQEHRTGFSYTGPPYFVRERPDTTTQVSTHTMTHTVDVIETEIISYKVSDRRTQTEYERDNHRLPAPKPPRASHVQIDFDTFDQNFLRPGLPRERIDELAKEVVKHKWYVWQTGQYKLAEPRIAWDSPSRKTHGFEPRSALMDMFNDINEIVQKELPNPPHFLTPLNYKYPWMPPQDEKSFPHSVPAVATHVYRGLRDLDWWENVVVFTDFRPDDGSTRPPSESTAADGDAEAQVLEVPEQLGEADKKGKRPRQSSVPASPSFHPPKRRKSGSKPPSSRATRATASTAPAPSLTAVLESYVMDVEMTAAPGQALPSASSSQLYHPPPGSGPYTIFKEEDIMMSKYALEALTALGNRRHIIGICVTGWDVQFFLYDHSGSVRTNRLSLWRDGDREKIVAAILSISMSSHEHLGLQRMVNPKGWANESQEEREQRFGSIRDCEISVCGIRYRVHELMHTDRVLCGRGITVYSASPLKDDDDEYGNEMEIIGESDEQREARRKKKKELELIPEAVAIRFQWRLVSDRPSPSSDDVLFNTIYERLQQRVDADALGTAEGKNDNGEGSQVVPYVHSSRVAGRLSDGPRGDGLVSEEFYQDRVLRVQVMSPLAEPLHALNDYRRPKAMGGCLRALRELNNTARVFHRNVSPNNLFVRINNEGIFYDLQYAINTDGTSISTSKPPSPLPAPQHDVPSMLPIDFLQHMVDHPLAYPLSTSSKPATTPEQPQPRYLFRHDLESFLYSAIWIETHYRQGKLAYALCLPEWMAGSPSEELASKQSLLHALSSLPSATATTEAIDTTPASTSAPATITPPSSSSDFQFDWPTFTNQTIIPQLAKMFHEGYKAREIARDEGRESEFDEESLGGYVSYEKMLEICMTKDPDGEESEDDEMEDGEGEGENEDQGEDKD